MKRFLLPLVALSIALTSCSRDNDDVINNPITHPVEQEQGQILTEISSDKDTWSYWRFNYIGDRLQSSSVGAKTTSYTYAGDVISEMTLTQGTGVEGTKKLKFTYNPDGTLKSTYETHTNNTSIFQVIGYPNVTLIGISNREYSYAGNTIKVVETVNSFTEPHVPGYLSFLPPSYNTIEYTLTMENGNLVRKEVVRDDGYTSKATYKYDDKVNPLNKIKGLSAIAIELNLTDSLVNFYDILGYKNNIIYQNIDGTIKHYEYEYGNKGLPTKQKIKYTHNNQAHTEVRNYTYK